MAEQLITTTNTQQLHFLCESSDIIKDYQHQYQHLADLLEPEKLGFFSRPEFKGNDKINWYTRYEGNIYPLSKASETIEEPYELLRTQANAIYLYILDKVSDLEDRRKIFDFLDKCMTVESANDIYLVISPDGQKNFCITAWGNNTKKQVNVLASVVDVKKIDIAVKLISQGKPYANKEIWIKIGESELSLKSDEQGFVYLKDMDLLSEFTIVQKKGKKVISQKKFIVDRQLYTFEVIGTTISKVIVKAVDQQNKPLAGANLEVQVADKVYKLKTNEQGIIELYDVPLGGHLVVIQSITTSKKIKQTFILKNEQTTYVFVGEKVSGNYLLIKVFDADGKPFPGAEMEILIGDQRIEKTANDSGFIVVNDIPVNTEVIVRQLINGLPSFQQKFVYTGENKEVTFRSHAHRKELKNIKVVLHDVNKKPIKNLSVKIINGYDWHYAITDEQGVAVFEGIDCTKDTHIEIKYRGKQITEPITCQENTTFEFVLGTKSAKILTFVVAIILLAAIVAAGINLLSGSKSNGQEQSNQLADSSQNSVVITKPQLVNTKVYVYSKFLGTPITDFNVKVSDSIVKLAKDSAYFIVRSEKDKKIDLFITAANYDTLRQQLTAGAVDTVFLKPIDLFIATDTTCNSYIISKRFKYYVQTIRFAQKVNSFGFKFIRRYTSDQVKIFQGTKKDMIYKKPVWEHTGIMPDTLITRINLPRPDSLVTIFIKAGEPHTPSWRFKIYCK